MSLLLASCLKSYAEFKSTAHQMNSTCKTSLKEQKIYSLPRLLDAMDN